ncbi:MAG: hypothetical protein ACLR8X_03995 [Gallintestinimicrobium sp.]
MTIIESIVQFLNQYEKEKIGVDKLGSDTMSYSLMEGAAGECPAFYQRAGSTYGLLPAGGPSGCDQ